MRIRETEEKRITSPRCSPLDGGDLGLLSGETAGLFSSADGSIPSL